MERKRALEIAREVAANEWRAGDARATAITMLVRDLDGVRRLVRDYAAAMMDEDLEDEYAFRTRLFDWAGV